MPSSLASAASSPVPAPRLHVLVEEEAAAAAAAEEGRDVLSPLPTTGGSNGRSSLSRAAGGAQKQKRGRQTTTGHHHHHQQQRQMKVVARIRPLSAAEVAGGCTESVVPIVPAAAADDVDGGGGTTSLLAGGNVGSGSNSGGSKSPSAAAAVPKRFDYDAVLPSSADQRAVYDRSVGDAVRRNVFRGYSTTIIAYGQTASGKTYTMNGPAAAAAAEAPDLDLDAAAGNRHRQSSLSRAAAALNESDGILPRAVHDLFDARRAGQREAKIHLSYLEIYNDAIRDLLGGDDDNGGGGGGGGGDGANLPLLDDGHGVSVRGLSSIEVRTAGEARELMDLASLRRTTGVSGEGVGVACHVMYHHH